MQSSSFVLVRYMVSSFDPGEWHFNHRLYKKDGHSNHDTPIGFETLMLAYCFILNVNFKTEYLLKPVAKGYFDD